MTTATSDRAAIILLDRPKTGGTVECIIDGAGAGSGPTVTLDLTTAAPVTRFEKDATTSLAVPLPEPALAAARKLQVRVTLDSDYAGFYSSATATKDLVLKSAAAPSRDLELAPIVGIQPPPGQASPGTAWSLTFRWRSADSTTPYTELIYGTNAVEVEKAAQRLPVVEDPTGLIIKNAAELAIQGESYALKLDLSAEASARDYWYAVRDITGRRSKVVPWVRPKAATLSFPPESKLQLPLLSQQEPSPELPPLVQPEAAYTTIKLLDKRTAPNRRLRSWQLPLPSLNLVEQLEIPLFSGPLDKRVLQQELDPRSEVPLLPLPVLLLTASEAQRISPSNNTLQLFRKATSFDDCALGDFDGDGAQDLIAVGATLGAPQVFRLSAVFSDTPSEAISLQISANSSGLLVGDLTGIGRDTAVLSSGTAVDGSTTSSPYPSNSEAIIGWKTAALVDLDSDNNLDILALRIVPDRVQLVGLRHSANPTATDQLRTLLDAPAAGSAGQIVVVDLDNDGAREIVWRRANGDIYVRRGMRIAGSGREDWSGLFSTDEPVFTSSPDVVVEPEARTPLAVGDLDRDGLPDLTSVNASGTTLEVIKPSTDLATHAGRPEFLGSVTLDNATNPAWLTRPAVGSTPTSDHLVVVQKVDGTDVNRIVFLDPWSATAPPSPVDISDTSSIAEIASGSRAGVGSIIIRTAAGAVGTVSASGTTTSALGTANANSLYPSPALDRNRVVDLLWGTASGVAGRTDNGTTSISIALQLTRCAVGDIDGDAVTDILHQQGPNLSVSRLTSSASWQTVTLPNAAADDVRALAILKPRGLLARFLVARQTGASTTIQEYSTNLATPQPSIDATWSINTGSDELKGLLAIPEAGRELMFLHTSSGLYALDKDPTAAIRLLPGTFDGFEFASLSGDSGMDLVSWRKEGTAPAEKTVIEYWLLPRQTTPPQPQ